MKESGELVVQDEEQVAMRDYTAAAESVKLREWGQAKPKASPRGGKKAGEKPPWHSPRYNPKVSLVLCLLLSNHPFYVCKPPSFHFTDVGDPCLPWQLQKGSPTKVA